MRLSLRVFLGFFLVVGLAAYFLLSTFLQEVKPAVIPRAVLVANHRSFSWITDKICGIIEGKTPAWWWWCFIVACFVASFTVAGLTYLVATGVGVTGDHKAPNTSRRRDPCSGSPGSSRTKALS